jgi:hypothetical protein
MEHLHPSRTLLKVETVQCRRPALAPCAARQGRARGPRSHCASGPSAISAQWHPVKFYYFLIYSIHCKFKNLCMIRLNSENYETNFVGKV